MDWINFYQTFVYLDHDQVLTPLKTIYEYDAINITLGLPYIRISPDHDTFLKLHHILSCFVSKK